MNDGETGGDALEGSPVFATTHWSLVLAAGDKDAAQSAAALERLCQTYWYPVYAYVRRKGFSAEDAQDLTQEFFRRLLERNWLPQADRQRGRFRSFLLGAVNHFLAHQWERAKAIKRGGRILFQSLDDETFEQRYVQEAQVVCSPEDLYEQRWATTLLQTVLVRLREEEAAANRLAQFNALEICLTGDRRSETYSELAERLGTTDGALKMAAHRLRSRYAQLLKDEIANTVAQPDEVQDEVRHLFAVLSR
jgi:RNA polymerase sigma-70 factor (ECF subfamily)